MPQPTRDAMKEGNKKDVRCVFGATISRGPLKGEMYECGARAVADYFDRIYKCRRPVCKRHANVIRLKEEKFPMNRDLRFFDAVTPPHRP